MEPQIILDHLDELLRTCQLEKAELYLEQQLTAAKQNGARELQAALYNEQMGFYRDCGNFPKALAAAANARELYEKRGETQTISYATTLLNCANVYRAAGAYADAFATFQAVKPLYDRLLAPEDSRIAGYFNNLALLYQETEQWENACDCLETALRMVRKQKDEPKIAVSCTNLATSLLKRKQVDRAETLLKEAEMLLKGRSPSDFHYSAVLSGLGDVCCKRQQFERAAAYYEAALSEIELHMGRNPFYELVLDRLHNAYEMAGSHRPELSGLELSRRFYEAFGEPMLSRCFPELLPRLAIGLAGEGSECLGYDDALSRDHDFGPGFCIWASDDTPQEVLEALRSAYAVLPRTFYGCKRIETEPAAGIIGVSTAGAFYQRLLELDHGPRTEAEWLSVSESGLAAVCGGAVFRDDSGLLSDRKRLQQGYPRAVRLRRLAQQLARMAQCGQYNYGRMRRRGDYAAAQIYLVQFCQHAMLAAHLCSKRYAPYEKWLLRSTKQLSGYADFARQIEQLLLHAPACRSCFSESEDVICRGIQAICNRIEQEGSKMLQKNPEESVYLEDTARKLAAQAAAMEQHEATVQELVRLEWEAFDKVQGIDGRAGCQDDWDTFSIMRSSQYLVWPQKLLEQWTAFFREAWQSGRNLITEKYARMMERTDPDRYPSLAAQLPSLSEEFCQIREAIVSIQVPWMEEFAKRYPSLAGQARGIHSELDTKEATSYETYLRGELSTYPIELLYDYGRWIAELARAGKNLAQMILEQTVHAYGYSDLQTAEREMQL